jgi:hypothetical protein
MFLEKLEVTRPAASPPAMDNQHHKKQEKVKAINSSTNRKFTQ